MNINLPETYLLASFEDLRISFYSKVMEKVYENKRSSNGVVLEEYRDDLYTALRKHIDIKTLQQLNKIKNKDPIYKEFNKKYLKNNMALRMGIIKCEKAIVIEIFKNVGEVKTINDVNFISYKDFEFLYNNFISGLIDETV